MTNRHLGQPVPARDQEVPLTHYPLHGSWRRKVESTFRPQFPSYVLREVLYYVSTDYEIWETASEIKVWNELNIRCSTMKHLCIIDIGASRPMSSMDGI